MAFTISGLQILRQMVDFPYFARLTMPSFAREGFSADTYMKYLSAAGIGVRHQVGHAYFREFGRPEFYKEKIATLLPGQIVPKNWITQTHDKLATKYKAIFNVDIYDPDLGDFITEIKSIGLNYMLPSGSYKSILEDVLQSRDYYQDLQYGNIEMIQFEERI